jgi:sn-glycerol 3-phosphate transport system substrate-binding protein
MRFNALTATLFAAGLFGSNAAQAQVEIQWWHSMTGALGDKVNEIANGFNASQKEYKILPVYKGAYPESMTAAIAAFRAGSAPHILQVFEVGTATMMAAKGAIKPVYLMMKEANEPFDAKNYLPAVAGYYADSKGNLLSLPFNSSTPVFYVNKDAFKKAGINPDPARRELQCLAQPAHRHQGKRHCGHGYRVQDQLAGTCGTHCHACRFRKEGMVYLFRQAQRS